MIGARSLLSARCLSYSCPICTGYGFTCTASSHFTLPRAWDTGWGALALDPHPNPYWCRYMVCGWSDYRILRLQDRAKNPAKFSDTYSFTADGLCIGCLGQWAETGRENSNMQESFCTTLYNRMEKYWTWIRAKMNPNPAVGSRGPSGGGRKGPLWWSQLCSASAACRIHWYP